MKKASITEAKNNLSALIDRVKGGSSILIVDRGRPVARIVPIPQGDEYERLIADGEVSPGSGRWREYEPLPPLPGKSLSQSLAELRDEDER